MSDEICLDPAALARLRELGGAGFTHQMLGLFLDLAREKLGAAQAAEQGGDLPGIQKAIHPLRSSSGNVGAVRMLGLATRIEGLAMAGEGEEISPLLRELEAAFAQVKPQLEREREALGV